MGAQIGSQLFSSQRARCLKRASACLPNIIPSNSQAKVEQGGLMSVIQSIALLSVITFFSGCSILRKVHSEDLQAWQGVHVSELETHPAYSVMNLRKQELSTGDLLFDYIDSKTYTEDIDCNTNSGQTTCSGGETYTVSCHHQFFVKDNKIREYRTLGKRCFTDCSRRPASNKCKD